MSGRPTPGGIFAIEGSRTMTLADRTTPSSFSDDLPRPLRSWRSRILRSLPPDPTPGPRTPRKTSPLSTSRPKPADEIADLLLMSMLDTKAPPETAGSADLLDTLVQNDLAHAEPAAGALPPEASTAPAVAPDLSDEERTALLQREIETLLHDANAAAESASPKAAHPPAAPASANSDISPEELDTLLADQAQAIAPDLPAASLAPSTSAQTEQQLSDAEGLLAEELNQLMAETAAPAPPAASAPAPEPAAPAHPLAASAKSPVAEASKPTAVSAPAPSDAAPIAPPTAAPAGPLPLTPEEARAAEAEAADAVQSPASKPHRRHILHDVALLVAQIIDVPFGWISELDKNVIGVAAFLLLLGGVVLYTLSRVVR